MFEERHSDIAAAANQLTTVISRGKGAHIRRGILSHLQYPISHFLLSSPRLSLSFHSLYNIINYPCESLSDSFSLFPTPPFLSLGFSPVHDFASHDFLEFLELERMKKHGFCKIIHVICHIYICKNKFQGNIDDEVKENLEEIYYISFDFI